jgi:hypothetical protein
MSSGGALTLLLRACSLLSLLCLFTLQVLGGAGAFWGATQVYLLRTNSSLSLANGWFDAADWIGALCLLRFVYTQALDPKAWEAFESAAAAQAGLPRSRRSVWWSLGRALESPVQALWHGLELGEPEGGGRAAEADEGSQAGAELLAAAK